MANPSSSAQFLRFVLATTIAAFQVVPPLGQEIDSRGQAPHTLARLSPPSDVLPPGCRLTQTGLFGANPTVTTDPKALAVIYMWVIGARQADEKPAQRSERNATGKENPQASVERLIAEAVAVADTGYAAFFREEGGSHEIGVYALRLKKPLTDQEGQRVRASPGVDGPAALRMVKGSVVVLAWSDRRPDAPDRGCWDVVRRHLEQVDVR